MYIYKITNKLNGKFYIGQTVNIASRMRQHVKDSSTLIDKEISKLGWNNFSYEVILECNQCDVDLLEMYFIVKTSSYVRDIGYNVRHSFLTNEEISYAEMLLNNIRSGSYVLDNVYLTNTYRKVICLDNNFEFLSIASCGRFFNMDPSHITDVCIGRRATTNNLTFRYLDDDGNIIEPTGTVHKKTREVFVEETKAIYPSIKAACDDLGLDYDKCSRSICRQLKGVHEKAYGYHFSYVENDEVLPTGYEDRRSKRQVIVDRAVIFDSVSEAIRYYGLPKDARGAIGQCCNGKSSSAYGHTWNYLDENGDIVESNFQFSKIDRSKVKRFEIVCDNSVTFRSLAKATAALGWNRNEARKIADVCKQGGGMYRGHYWMYGKQI